MNCPIRIDASSNYLFSLAIALLLKSKNKLDITVKVYQHFSAKFTTRKELL